MGTFVKIELKTKSESNITKKNKALKVLCIDNAFMSEQDFLDWADDVKHNPNQLSVEEIKETFKWTAQLGVLMFDVAFDRTSDEDAAKYIKFIVSNKESIESVHNAMELIERYDLTDEQKKVISKFVIKPTEPEKLPVDKQYIPDLQSGLMLCKTFSPTPFWVVFGNVKRPTFLKEKIYVEDIYNDIYRDKKGYAYMLLPLMPVNNKQLEFAYQVFEHAWDMGLREDPNYFLPVIYGMGVSNLNTVAESYNDFYTHEELLERFKTLLNQFNQTNTYNTNEGFIWKDNISRFMSINKAGIIQEKCNVLTCLVRACRDKNEIANIMSKTIGKIFKAFEFKETIAVSNRT